MWKVVASSLCRPRETSKESHPSGRLIWGLSGKCRSQSPWVGLAFHDAVLTGRAFVKGLGPEAFELQGGGRNFRTWHSWGSPWKGIFCLHYFDSPSLPSTPLHQYPTAAALCFFSCPYGHLSHLSPHFILTIPHPPSYHTPSASNDNFISPSKLYSIKDGHKGKIPEPNSNGLYYKIKNQQRGPHKGAKFL